MLGSGASCLVSLAAQVGHLMLFVTWAVAPFVQVAVHHQPAGKLESPIADVKLISVGVGAIELAQHHDACSFRWGELTDEFSWFRFASLGQVHANCPLRAMVGAAAEGRKGHSFRV
jgi:hypothetical protein